MAQRASRDGDAPRESKEGDGSELNGDERTRAA
jgi:hypothetical protein